MVRTPVVGAAPAPLGSHSMLSAKMEQPQCAWMRVRSPPYPQQHNCFPLLPTPFKEKKGLVFMTWQHLVFIPPFGTLVPLLLRRPVFTAQLPALCGPQLNNLILNLRRVTDIDREFRVGSPSTREEMTYYAASPCQPVSVLSSN